MGNVSGPAKPKPTLSSADRPVPAASHHAAPKNRAFRKFIRRKCAQAGERSKSLFGEKVNYDVTSMRMRAVFPKINALPCAKRESSHRNRNGEIYGSERSPDVRGHVIVALSSMLEKRI